MGQNSKSMEDCGAESELNLRGGMAQEVSGKKYKYVAWISFLRYLREEIGWFLIFSEKSA